MTRATRAWIAATPSLVVCEHALDRALVQQAKTAIRRLAAEQGIDLGRERVSIWRLRGPQEFEQVASARSLYQAVQLAETFGEDLFLFNAPAGDVLTLVAASVGEGE